MESNKEGNTKLPSKSNHKRFAILFVLATSIPFFFGRWKPTLTNSLQPSSSSCASSRVKKENQDSVIGWVHPNVTFGHLHMGKTAGTTVNGYLAAHYERVCGNKGRSYNAFPYNILRNGTKKGKFKGTSLFEQPLDGNGWEDCDYISSEKPWDFWTERFSDRNMEMHVPCRGPVDHLMSMCNHQRKAFNCQAEDLDAEIDHCFLIFNKWRFSMQFVWETDFQFKCFAYEQLDQYFDYIGGILQRRRLEVNFVKRVTNRNRNKDEECIWKNHSLARRVRKRMLKKYGYYSFCHACLNSEDNLLR